MSSEEKRTWISALVAVVVAIAYLATVLSKVPGTDVASIAYVGPMLTSIGVGIGAAIVLSIVAAMVSPKDADRTDERDREINRRGEYVGFYVMSIAAIVPLVLAMARGRALLDRSCALPGVRPGRAGLVGREDRRVPAGLVAMGKPTRVTNSIRALRFAHGEMTQAELADHIGVTRQTIIAIEQGRYSPSLEVAFQIARVFRVPLDDVFGYPDTHE